MLMSCLLVNHIVDFSKEISPRVYTVYMYIRILYAHTYTLIIHKRNTHSYTYISIYNIAARALEPHKSVFMHYTCDIGLSRC